MEDKNTGKVNDAATSGAGREEAIKRDLLNSSPVNPAPIGLGDVIASVAQPIAKVIDAVAGTNVAGCGACAKRQAALNAAFPFK
jgi:hypothetical protein